MKYVSDDVSDDVWTERSKNACAGCGSCDGNPPLRKSDESDNEDSQDFFDEIKDIVECENAGSKTNWNLYPFEHFELVKHWRATELVIKNKRDFYFATYIKSKFKDS